MRASRQPSTLAPPAIGDEPSVDPGILAFGTSVSVNDDLCRSILTEIEEIDESISTTASQIKTEEKSQEELRKSRGNSIKESRSILETVTENFGTLDMQRRMLKNLEHTFQAEIAPGSTVVSPDRETNGATNQDTAESNGAAENLPPTIGSLSVASLQKEHMTVETSLVAMKEAVVASIRDLQHLAAEKKTHLTAAAEIQNRIEAENLSGLLEELEEKMKYGEHVKQSEIKRQSTLMTNHDAAEERVQKAQKAKQAMEAEISRKKQEWSAETAELDKKATKAKEKTLHAKTLLENLHTDALAVKNGHAQAEKSLEDAAQSIKRRQEMKVKREALRAERIAFNAEKEKLEAAIAASKKQMEQSQRTILKNVKENSSIEAYKEENDKLQAQHVLPGASEHKDILKQIDEIKARMEELKSDPELSKRVKELQEVKEELEGWKNEIKSLSASLVGKEAELADFKRVLDDHTENVAKEFSEVEEELKDFEKKCAEEEIRLEELDQELGQIHAKSNHAELYRKLQILCLGAERLKLTAKREKLICDLDADPADI